MNPLYSQVANQPSWMIAKSKSAGEADMGLYDKVVPTEAEQRVLDAALTGKACNFKVGDETLDDPANGEDWGEERTLRADFLFILLTDSRGDWDQPPKGVQIIGAKVEGTLNLSGQSIQILVALIECFFPEGIDISYAQ